MSIRHATLKRLVIAAIAVVTSSCTVDSAPDVGMIDPVYAEPAEDIRILALGRGQTIGQLLDGAVSYNEQASLLLAFREHASPRRMRPGTEITLRYRPEDEWLRGVDVQINRDESVRLTRDEVGWSSGLITTPVYVDTVFASGSIETVLWTAVVGNPALASMPAGDRNRLIDHLDRVFQWQIDFSSQIRVGDT